MNIRILTFSILVGTAIAAIAQDDKTAELQALYRQETARSQHLERQVKALKSDSVEAAKTIRGLNGDIEKLNAQISDLKARQTKSEMARLRHEVDSLNRVVATLRETASAADHSAGETQATLRAERDRAVSELQKLEAFRKEFVADQVRRAEAYLAQPYTRISADTLAVLCAAVRPYVAADSQMAAIDKRLATMERLKQEVEDFTGLLNRPLDTQGIIMARKRITEMKTELHPAQWAEVDTLDIYLSRYYSGAKLFKKIIAEVDTEMQTYRESAKKETPSPANIRSVTESTVKPIFVKYGKEADRLITHVPYLATRYKTYRTAMEHNPYKRQTELEAEIRALPTD